MKYKQKIVLFTIGPVILAMMAIVWWLDVQTHDFSKRQAGEFEKVIIDMRKSQLRDNIEIIQSAFSRLKPSGDPEQDEKIASQIFQTLEEISYSEDGYFYLYDSEGVSLVHPKQPFRIGKQWLSLTDKNGVEILQELLRNAENGGGYTAYQWEKPSINQDSPKIGYSEMLGDWGWMVGTGAYVDDIETQVDSIQEVMSPHITDTLNKGAFIGAMAVVAVFASGLFLQINEKKLADKKLRELTRRIVLTQDEERRRVSRELHDSISQSLIGVKYMMEEVQASGGGSDSNFDQSLGQITSYLDSTLNEVRRISRDLHPSILDDIGLMAAVDALIVSFRDRTGIEVDFESVKVRGLLPKDARTALYRTVQEALTNVERHAGASHVAVRFRIESKWFGVSIQDNGRGIDSASAQRRAEAKGIGLRNISERLSYFDGVCQLDSSTQGTKLFAGIPKSLLRRSISEFERT